MPLSPLRPNRSAILTAGTVGCQGCDSGPCERLQRNVLGAVPRPPNKVVHIGTRRGTQVSALPRSGNRVHHGAEGLYRCRPVRSAVATIAGTTNDHPTTRTDKEAQSDDFAQRRDAFRLAGRPGPGRSPSPTLPCWPRRWSRWRPALGTSASRELSGATQSDPRRMWTAVAGARSGDEGRRVDWEGPRTRHGQPVRGLQPFVRGSRGWLGHGLRQRGACRVVGDSRSAMNDSWTGPGSEWANPSTWPISCMTTVSRSIRGALAPGSATDQPQPAAVASMVTDRPRASPSTSPSRSAMLNTIPPRSASGSSLDQRSFACATTCCKSSAVSAAAGTCRAGAGAVAVERRTVVVGDRDRPGRSRDRGVRRARQGDGERLVRLGRPIAVDRDRDRLTSATPGANVSVPVLGDVVGAGGRGPVGRRVRRPSRSASTPPTA